MSKTAVIAFGGKALLRSGQEGFYQEQIANVEETCESILPLVKAGYKIVIGHGNGPQVGNVLSQHEMANRVSGIVAMPLDFCVAETQGSIGYLIEQGLRNMLRKHGIEKDVIGMITQVVVDHNDPLFVNPTKPIGRYFKEKQLDAFRQEHPDAVFKEDPKGNGWRRVVASPQPIDILNVKPVETLIEAGNIVITVGGGGVPVVCENGQYRGVEAVIDKDLSSAMLAEKLHADEFYILTDVPKVYINFRKPDEKALDVVTIADARRYLAEGQFTEGSMAPKIRAAIRFVENCGGTCIITEAGQLENPACGTRIVR